MILLVVLVIVSLIISVLSIILIYKNPSHILRRFTLKHKKIYGVNDKGISMDTHETLHFFSCEEMGM